MHNIFVYGTLKRNFIATGLNRFPEADYIGGAVTTDAKYTLYDLGRFPAAMLDGDSHIKGEMWSLTDDLMKVIDYYEGYPSLFDRTMIDTSAGQAWMYHLSSSTNFSPKKIEPDVNNIVEWKR